MSRVNVGVEKFASCSRLDLMPEAGLDAHRMAGVDKQAPALKEERHQPHAHVHKLQLRVVVPERRLIRRHEVAGDEDTVRLVQCGCVTGSGLIPDMCLCPCVEEVLIG